MEVSRKAEGFPGQRLVVVPSEVVERGLGMPVVRDLIVTHLGHFNSAPGHYVRRLKGARQWVMIYCLGGAGAVEFGGGRHELGEGDLVLLPPGEAHLYEADLLAPWSIFWFHFGGRRVADWVEVLGWTREEPLLHVPGREGMLEVLEDVYRHTLHGYPDADVLGLTAEFGRLLGAVRMRTRARDLRARKTEDRILEVLRQLREEPERRWTVAQMAKAARLSTPHFAELFRLQTGSPPLTFLIRLRLQLACSILEREAITIEETAHRVGYEDAYYFSRLFCKHLGVAPSSYREELRGGGRKGRHRPGLFA